MAAKSNNQSEEKENKSSSREPEFRSRRRLEPERDLFVWTAPARPFKRRDRKFWTTVLAIVGITGLVLFLVEGMMPVLLVISLVFLFYILTTVEPDDINYRITNRGVRIADRLTEWDLITRYWFASRFDSKLLVFELLSIPGRLELVVTDKDSKKIKKALKDYVLEEEASPSKIDKAADWFSKKLPS